MGDAGHAAAARTQPEAGGRRLTGLWGLALLLGVCLTAPAAAQTRGTLQVSTRVLPPLASRMALTEAFGGAVAPVALARITREVLPDSLAVAQRPRTRITIAFVRN